MLRFVRSFCSTVLKNTNQVKLASTIVKPKMESRGDMFFLHALFGNRNSLAELTKGKYISSYFTSHLLDVRNHGDSDHCSTMTYKEMALDVARYAEEKGIDKYMLCGHSMGGKIAMALAALYPNRVSDIIVMSAPPKDVRNGIRYLARTKPGLDKMKKLVTFQKEQQWGDVVNEFYQAFTGGDALFAVLLERNLLNIDGKPVWKSNMKTIAENAENFFGYEDLGQYKKENNVLIIMGEKSIIHSLDVYKKVFPTIDEQNIRIIPNAGHWVYVDKVKETQRTIDEFLKSKYQL